MLPDCRRLASKTAGCQLIKYSYAAMSCKIREVGGVQSQYHANLQATWRRIKKRGRKREKKPKTERPQQVDTALLPSLFSHELLMLPPSFLLLLWLLAIFNRYTHLIRGFSFTLSRFFSGPGPQGSHFGRQLLWLLWLLHGIPLL